jgi:hypothetical protein
MVLRWIQCSCRGPRAPSSKSTDDLGGDLAYLDATWSLFCGFNAISSTGCKGFVSFSIILAAANSTLSDNLMAIPSSWL